MPFDILPQRVVRIPADALKYHTTAEIDEMHNRLMKTFETGATIPLAYRRNQLLQLGRMLQQNFTLFEDSLIADLNKPRLETAELELSQLVTAVLTAVENLEEWAAPVPCPTKEQWRSQWDAKQHPEPKGVVLIISPWNYPLILTLNPLIGAIAAGCPAALKLSEHVPTFCELLTRLLPAYLDPKAYVVIKGNVPETTHTLALRWDHIFYTGSADVGRVVAVAAGKNLTPLTLELGGKSPAVISDDCTDLDLVARRIWWGKLLNAGQLCVIPDYALVPKSKVDAFVNSLKKAQAEFWPNGDDPLTGSSPISNIVHARQHAHLVDLLRRTKGKVAFGGETYKDKSVAPTVLVDVPVDDVLMDAEIFGPVLPIIAVDDINSAIQVLNAKPIPLVIYLFTEQDDLKRKFLRETRSGTLVVNDVIMQLKVHEMPFGGQGESGYGAWFGKTTFDVFSHFRGCITVPFSDEKMFEKRYRPYTEEKYQAACAPGRAKLPDA